MTWNTTGCPPGQAHDDFFYYPYGIDQTPRRTDCSLSIEAMRGVYFAFFALFVAWAPLSLIGALRARMVNKWHIAIHAAWSVMNLFWIPLTFILATGGSRPALFVCFALVSTGQALCMIPTFFFFQSLAQKIVLNRGAGALDSQQARDFFARLYSEDLVLRLLLLVTLLAIPCTVTALVLLAVDVANGSDSSFYLQMQLCARAFRGMHS